MNILENLQYVVIGKFSYGWPELDKLRTAIPVVLWSENSLTDSHWTDLL